MDRVPEPGNGSAEELEFDERLELYALDLLEDDEAADVERLLARDPDARARVRELRGVTAMLAFDIEPVEASPDLKSRILAAARADLEQEQRAPGGDSRAAPISLAAERKRRRGIPAWSGWATAAVLALALIGSLIWNAQLRGDLDERAETITFAITTQGQASGASGEVLYISDGGQPTTLVLTLTNMPALQPGQVYKVWLFAEDTPQPSVAFVPDAVGRASVGVPDDIQPYDLLAVSIETDPNVTTPSSDVVVVSDLTKADAS
jgi:hypothetical protein